MSPPTQAWSRGLTLFGALLVLAAVNLSIVAKERIARHGEVVFLRLAPVDPRSLMQGDYMSLRFALAEQISDRDRRAEPQPREGETRYAAIQPDDRRVATLAGAGAATPLKLRYRIRNRQVWLGTNAFFFQEGNEPRYATARYGEFRVDRDSGEAVLIGLRDEGLKPL